jgi:hypothetical protein
MLESSPVETFQLLCCVDTKEREGEGIIHKG